MNNDPTVNHYTQEDFLEYLGNIECGTTLELVASHGGGSDLLFKQKCKCVTDNTEWDEYICVTLDDNEVLE